MQWPESENAFRPFWHRQRRGTVACWSNHMRSALSPCPCKSLSVDCFRLAARRRFRRESDGPCASVCGGCRGGGCSRPCSRARFLPPVPQATRTGLSAALSFHADGKLSHAGVTMLRPGILPADGRDSARICLLPWLISSVTQRRVPAMEYIPIKQGRGGVRDIRH